MSLDCYEESESSFELCSVRILCKTDDIKTTKKPKPIGEESFSSNLFFEKNDPSYVDRIVDPDRKIRAGAKGYPPSSIFMALLLMYLRNTESILELVRFLNKNPEWLFFDTWFEEACKGKDPL
jgi:hypothetical protein